MPIGGVPLIENQLSCIKVWGHYTNEDVDLLDQFVSQSTLVQSDHLSHSIWDFSEMESLPGIKKMSSLNSADHKYIGWVIIVGMPNKAFKFMISVACQVFKLRVRFMDTYDEAVHFLKMVDSTLPDFSVTDVEEAMKQAQEQAEFVIVLET